VRRRRKARWLVLLVVTALVAGCGGPVLANPPAQRPVETPPPTPLPSTPGDPQAIVLPRDDGPHDRLTEWWYYTGHLMTDRGRRFGFEYVMFRARRGSFPVAWASHLAITDEQKQRFIYAQRNEVGPQVDRRAPDHAGGFDFSLGSPLAGGDATWTMTGADGDDRLTATTTPNEASALVSLDLTVRTTKPPALHDRDGWIDFGSAGGSYYYSRTRMSAAGTLRLDSDEFAVTGEAWFDHQWGDFIAVGGGGWDWFAINLGDGGDLTLSLVRDRAGTYPLVYGTLVDRAGVARHLERADFTVEVTRRWTSPRTGVDYPGGWRISVPSEALDIDLTPTVPDQELDTRATSGVVYWEGSQRVTATRDGRSVDGEAYVELTGYGPQ
jgi:predicted secreted hydrolase